jgi:hypothetical protein
MCIDWETGTCHWSRESQAYAPTHILLHYLRVGWRPSKRVTVEVILFGGNRQTQVYHFVLTRNSESLEMPVTAGPLVPRLIRDYDLTLREITSQLTTIHPREKSRERVMK